MKKGLFTVLVLLVALTLVALVIHTGLVGKVISEFGENESAETNETNESLAILSEENAAPETITVSGEGSESGQISVMGDSEIVSNSEWLMFKRYLNRTSWDGVDFPAISGLVMTNFTGLDTYYSSPMVSGGYVYIGNGGKQVYQLNASNVSQLIANFTARSGVSGAPAVMGGYIYIGCNDGDLYKLNASNVSQKIQNFSTGSSVQSAPAVYNGYLYFGANAATIGFFQVNATDLSQIIGNFTTGGSSCSSPAIADNYVYVGCAGKGILQLNASNVSQLIANHTSYDIYSSPAVANGYVYVGSGDYQFYQLNASNVSQKINNFTTMKEVYSSPAVANGYVYVGSRDSVVYQLNATNVSQRIANFTAGASGIHISSPAVANGYVYIGAQNGQVYQLNASNVSQLIANFTTGSGVYSSPAVAKDYVYIGSFDKQLYQLYAPNISQTTMPAPPWQSTPGQIDSCQVLNVPGTYTLNKSLSSNGTCFVISNSSIILDGNGFTLTYGINGTLRQYGVHAVGYNNLTIKNFNFTQGNNTADAAAINFTMVQNATVIYNNITTYGIRAHAVALHTSNYSVVSSNNMDTWGERGFGVYLNMSSNCTFDSNNYTSNSSGGCGAYITVNSHNNWITNNRIYTRAAVAVGVYCIYTSNGNNLISNNIHTIGFTAYGVMNTNGCNFTNITQNNITTEGFGTDAIRAFTSNNLTVMNNNVTCSGDNGVGLSLNSNSNFARIAYNNFTSSSKPTVAGIAVVNILTCHNGEASHNLISGRNMDRVYVNGARNNTLSNNTILIRNISYADFSWGTTAGNGTMLIDQYLENYTIKPQITLSVKNTNNGEIVFLTTVNGTGTNFSDDIRISSNLAYINSTQTSLNKSANITFYNLPTNVVSPKILRDGIECNSSICYNFTSLNAGTVIINVTGWSNYSIGIIPVAQAAEEGAVVASTTGGGGHAPIFVEITDPELTAGYSSEAAPNSRFIFKISGESHLLKIASVRTDGIMEVKVIISSTPVELILKVGDKKEVDVNGDGKSDILVELLGIKGDLANTRITALAEKAPETAAAPEVEKPSPEAQKSVSSVQVYILVATLVLALLLLIILLALKNKNKATAKAKKKNKK